MVEWRNGVEKDIDEVLQINNVFTNVSKGQIACMEDLKKTFRTDDINEILYEVASDAVFIDCIKGTDTQKGRDAGGREGEVISDGKRV